MIYILSWTTKKQLKHFSSYYIQSWRKLTDFSWTSLPWVPETFLARFPVSAYGRRCVGLRPTPKISAAREEKPLVPRVGLPLKFKDFFKTVRALKNNKRETKFTCAKGTGISNRLLEGAYFDVFVFTNRAKPKSDEESLLKQEKSQ